MHCPQEWFLSISLHYNASGKLQDILCEGLMATSAALGQVTEISTIAEDSDSYLERFEMQIIFVYACNIIASPQ